MFEMLVLCIFTIPASLWLILELLVNGSSRDPIAFSVLEMLALMVSAGMVVWAVVLVRGYRVAEKAGVGYIFSYGLLMLLGSLITSGVLLSQLLPLIPIHVNSFYWTVALPLIAIPGWGVFRLWRKPGHF